MSQRRISWIEQNVEKVVIGVVGVALVGVVALQALHQPNLVQVGTGPQVPPEQGGDPVLRSAQTLQEKINNANPAEVAGPGYDLTKNLDGQFTKPATSPAMKSALGSGTVIQASPDSGGAIGTDVYATLALPAPTSIIGATHVGTIDPRERVWHSELAALLPAQQPFDKVGVSVEGTLNGEAIIEALELDPDGNGPIQPIPRSLWRDAMSQEVLLTIVSVELERELIRPAPGTNEAVGTKTVVAGMPGRANARKYWDDSVRSRGDVTPVLQSLNGMAEQIERPPYYALIAGPSWDEPKEMAERWAVDNVAARVNKWKADLATAKQQLKDAEAELAKFPPAGAATPTPPAGRDAPPPPRGGRGGRGVAPPPGGGRQTPGNKEQDATTQRLNAQAKVNTLKGKVRSLEQRLSRAGVAIEQPADAEQANAPEPVANLFDNEELKLWVHDMTAQPGAVYRYRMRIVANNPLFGASVVNDQKELASKSLADGQWSTWSDPVDVDALSEFFLVSAAESNPPASIQPSSNAKLYVLYYGSYREANVAVNPGDTFVTEIKVPELPFYDLAALLEKYPDTQGAAGPANPAQDPRRVDPGGKGRPGIAPGGGREAPGAMPPEAEKSDGIIRIEGVPTTMGPKTLAAGVASIFLDAQRLIVPGVTLSQEQREVVSAILRDPSGQVVARSPETDRSSLSFKRIQAYLRAQALAKAPQNAPNPVGNQPPQPFPAPRPAPGGGGGAGGG